MKKPRLLIIGGGFGGINTANALKKASLDIVIYDRTNHHLFQPLLYQVATSTLSPADIAQPIREVLAKQKNCTVFLGDVESIDTRSKTIKLANENTDFYDYLVVATGGRHSYFGHDEWEKLAPGLKTLDDALSIREKILIAFEKAERCESQVEALGYLNFIIIGGGPTGVEMAGAIAEIASSMTKNFRRIRPKQAKIYLLEGTKQILPAYPEDLANRAKEDLEKLGVIVMTQAIVTNITDDGVWIGNNFQPSHTIIWAAGNQAGPVLKSLDVPLDRQGRVLVEKDLSIPGHPDVFVIGDAAHVLGENGQPVPGIAPAAIQEGKYVAKIIGKNIPPEQRDPFNYFDKGQMATIGRNKAVAISGRLKIKGFLAWLMWSFIHVFYLISFRNRVKVMLEWMFWYVTGYRTARLIVRYHKKKEEKSEDTNQKTE